MLVTIETIDKKATQKSTILLKALAIRRIMIENKAEKTLNFMTKSYPNRASCHSTLFFNCPFRSIIFFLASGKK